MNDSEMIKSRIDDESLAALNAKSANFVEGNKVYILGDFDKTISTNVIPKLTTMIEIMAGAKDPEIEFYINSFGGYAHELMALLSLIYMAKSLGIHIVTYNIGVAYSCGSILAVVGDEKYMYRYADNMIHLGSAMYDVQTFEQINRQTKHAKTWFENIVKIYTENSKATEKQIREMLMDDNCHLTPKECLKLGFCTTII